MSQLLGKVYGSESPEVNRLLQELSSPTSAVTVLEWENFARFKTKRITAWSSQGFWTFGQGMLIGLPIVGALIAYCLTVINTGVAAAQWWTPMFIFDIVVTIFLIILAGAILRRYGLL